MQVGQDSTRKLQHEDLRRRILEITQDLTNTKESVPLRVIVEVCMRVLHVEEHVLLAEILHLIKEGQLQRISVIFSKKVRELLTASAQQGNSSVLLDFVLLDPQRRNVYHAIQGAGGIIFSDLQAETNLGPNHLNLYLNQFCNLKLVDYVLMGRSRVFHLSSLDPKQAIVAHLFRKENYRKILLNLIESPQRLIQLTESLQVHHSSVQYFLKNLGEIGIIDEKNENSTTFYQLAEQFRRFVQLFAEIDQRKSQNLQEIQI